MTSNYRISQHGMDIVFKLEAEQLGSALARRYHIDLPPVVRYFPTELPFADIHLEQLDSIFELEDERLLRLEFQSEHRGDTLPRFLVQDALLYQRHRRRLATVVIYGAGINTAADGISAGAIEYSVSNIFIGRQDGEATYRRLTDQVAQTGGLSAEDRLDLIFLPLMRHIRPRNEIVRDALELARALPEEQQGQALASLLGLGHRFLNEAELDTLVEGLMTTTLGQRLVERGIEQGIERGIEQGMRTSLLRVLAERFGPLTAQLGEHVGKIDDVQRLETLLARAVSARSIEEFSRDLS